MVRDLQDAPFEVTECFDGLLVAHRALEPRAEYVWWDGVVLGQGWVGRDGVPVFELHRDDAVSELLSYPLDAGAML